MDLDPYRSRADPYAPPVDSPAATYVAPNPPPLAPMADPPRGRRFSTGGDWWSDRADLRQWAFLAGLAGGVLILVGAFALALFLTSMQLLGAGDADIWYLDDDNFPGIPLAVALWGLLSGGLVLMGALRLKEMDEISAMPGVIMLVGGLLSFFALGGFLVGGLASIVAGVLAIAAARTMMPPRDDRPPRRTARPLS